MLLSAFMRQVPLEAGAVRIRPLQSGALSPKPKGVRLYLWLGRPLTTQRSKSLMLTPNFGKWKHPPKTKTACQLLLILLGGIAF